MAYLPFYITPEELAAYQEAQEHEISSGQGFKNWQTKNVEEASRYIYLKMTSIPAAIFIILFFVLADLNNLSSALTLASGFCLSTSVIYFLLRLNFVKRYTYTLSDKGFVIKSQSTVPRWMNNATQAVGWIGAIVCILMVVLVGPMALAGAGAFILVSFKMLKRQPDEVAEIKVGKREDWLFAYYNKKRKVIRFYHKYDECSKWNLEKHTVFRAQTRGYSYIFFSTVQDLDAMLEILSNKYGIECIDFPDHKAFFEGRPEPRIEDIPSRSLEFPVADTFDLRAKNAPLPEWRRIYNGKWQTESEIERLKAAGEQQATPAS